MLFNSTAFVIFFVLFFFLYWFVAGKKLKLQNLLILAGSYVFYAWWDWRFLTLLILSSLVYYTLGICIPRAITPGKRNILIGTGVLYGVLTLGYFKYFNFFIDSLVDAFAIFDIHLQLHTLNIILPLGISFYTFRTISYLLDVDKGKIKPTTDWVVFFSYVVFFPSLMSGPIDRARTLIPQLEKPREFTFHQATDGMRQILWGLFKKIVIADNCAQITQQIFDNYTSLPVDTLLLGAFYYTIQLYADFSGYSDMAIGIARLLGFNIARNFNFPYFSQNIALYWRNWHISLTSWLTEYVFTPLSIRFRDYGAWGLIFAIVINFILVGIWHGANWTFVLFGLLHGCYFIPLILRGKMNKKAKPLVGSAIPSFRISMNIVGTFLLVMFTNVIFRSANITQAFDYYRQMFIRKTTVVADHLAFFHVKDIFLQSREMLVLLMIFLFFFVEWMGKESEHPLAVVGLQWKKPVRWLFYYTILFLIFFFAGEKQEFIYFQF